MLRIITAALFFSNLFLMHLHASEPPASEKVEAEESQQQAEDAAVRDTAAAVDDTLKAALDAYNAAVVDETTKLLVAIETAFERALRSGDLDLAKQAKDAAKRLRENGDPPTDSFMRGPREQAQRNLSRAAGKLRASYRARAKEVLKTGDVDAADALLNEASEIVGQTRLLNLAKQVDTAPKVQTKDVERRASAPGKALAGGDLRIDLVAIEDLGNEADENGYGSVDYEYRIGRYEITIEQYCRFLNAKAKSDPHGLYNAGMQGDASAPSIERQGDDGQYTYHIIPFAPENNREWAGQPMSPLRPITHVSWLSAARFCNWLHNGQRDSDTETGAYMLDGLRDRRVPRQANARFFLPSENEWYKAAFYDATKKDSEKPYSRFATQMDDPPVVWSEICGCGVLPAAEIAKRGSVLESRRNVVNWKSGLGGTFLALARVDQFPKTFSRYGCFGMSGNCAELLEGSGKEPLTSTVVRGGCWWDGAPDVSSASRQSVEVSAHSTTTGFRIAAAKE